MAATEDPGWAPAWRQRAALLLPQAAMRRARGIGDRVVGLRTIWLSFMLLHVVVGTLVLVWILTAELEEAVEPVTALLGVVVVVVGASYARWRTSRRELDCSDGRALADGYYVRFLRESAIAVVIMPWGILAGLFAASPAAYGLALVAGVANLVAMAPVRVRLAADEARLATEGCLVDLVAVLRTAGEQGGPGPGKKRRKGR